MRSIRPERVASLIRQELARVLLFETKDPGLMGIVLTGARVSPDLRVAWITYQLHDTSMTGREAAERGLARAGGYLRGCLKGKLAMKVLPELRFEFDKHSVAAERIDAILRDVDAGASSTNDEEGGS
jgi:ribosome-binding factor A